MGELERMSREEAQRAMGLADKILVVIESETDCTYQDTMRAIDAIRKNYEEKGRNLLNSKNIREVARFGAMLN